MSPSDNKSSTFWHLTFCNDIKKFRLHFFLYLCRWERLRQRMRRPPAAAWPGLLAAGRDDCQHSVRRPDNHQHHQAPPSTSTTNTTTTKHQKALPPTTTRRPDNHQHQHYHHHHQKTLGRLTTTTNHHQHHHQHHWKHFPPSPLPPQAAWRGKKHQQSNATSTRSTPMHQSHKS